MKRDFAVHEAKAKASVSYTGIEYLICIFVFAHILKTRISHNVAYWSIFLQDDRIC